MTHRRQLAVLAVLVAMAGWLGWRELWFLTDDAFIAFRYASNAVLGRGLVWNPAPFLPVEGYTSWLWVALLTVVWETTGIAPPEAANVLSLGFGYGTCLLVVRIVARMRLPPGLAAHRVALAALVLLGTLTNRTFLTWLSSGLETALFGFCITLWVGLAVEAPATRGRGWAPGLAAAASLCALARPGGWLAVAGSGALLLLDLRERPVAGAARARRLAGWTPLLAAPAHLVWRRATYGEWLPNTWYAKHVGAWPESGLRYAASFALEYGLWVWGLAALLWLARRPRLGPAELVVAAVLGGHFLYYTLVVGGDHFEYRIYSHLVPLLLLSLVAMGARAGWSARAVVGLLAVQVVASWPVAWTHHLATRGLTARADTHELHVPIASRFPPGARRVVGVFDALQAWLIAHHVGIRHAEHRALWRSLERSLPSREVGARIGWETRPVIATGNVGYVGWVLPHVAILDTFGLNDWVIARSPPADAAARRMAHDRVPPEGYLACFRPNPWRIRDGALVLGRREVPLRDEEIRRCEQRYREIVAAGEGAG